MHRSQRDPRGRNGVFELIGGLEGCRRISIRFHESVAGDAELRKLFPKDMASLGEHFALFLAERFGGPAAYTAERGKQSLVCRHAHLSISTEEADRWLTCMFAVLDEAGIGEPVRAYLREFFSETAKTLTDPFIPFYYLPLAELRATIETHHELLGQSQMGHSLLRDAVSRWDVARVRLLLEAGADVNTTEPRGHGLLYRAANSDGPARESAGREVCELLLQYGAAVNRPSGPGKSTPLHMAARRGHVLLAEAMLMSGADIEAKDSKGETPLRRAVNCNQEPMVRFLLSLGADAVSQDKFGRTLRDMARSEAIRVALR